MLQCSMIDAAALRLGLEDVLGDLWSARRREDLGRLALLVHCDLRRWARAAKEELLAARAQELVLNCPHSTREEFFRRVYLLIRDAERAHARLAPDSSEVGAAGRSPSGLEPPRETTVASCGK